MTTSAIIAALDVAGILCLVGAVAFAAVVIAELWWRHMGAMEAVKAGLPPRTRAGGQANAVSGRIDARSLRWWPSKTLNARPIHWAGMCQKATFGTQSNTDRNSSETASSFDHFVGTEQNRWR
jgi:hypothetical protein